MTNLPLATGERKDSLRSSWNDGVLLRQSGRRETEEGSGTVGGERWEGRGTTRSRLGNRNRTGDRTRKEVGEVSRGTRNI